MKSSGESLSLSLLLVLFVALKLMGYIDWSWWWVLSPIWGAMLLYLVVFAVTAAFVILREGRKK